MADDLERSLDEFYRKLSSPAGRLAARWRTPSPGFVRPARPSWGGWLAALGAVAAVLALLLFAPHSGRPGTSPPALVERPSKLDEGEPPLRAFEPPPAPPSPAETRPAPLAKEPARTEELVAPPAPPSAEPAPAVSPESPPPAERAPSPEASPGTRSSRAAVVFREVEGALQAGGRALRGRRRDLELGPGETLKAESVVRLSLADDRWVLLAPKTTLEAFSEEERVVLALDQGELLADLGGPGPRLAVRTRSCEVTPLGTVFSVSADERRTLVVVERGRVELRSARGQASLRAGELLEASLEGALGAPRTTDLRTLGWARAHRAPESIVFSEDFARPGAWEGIVEKGFAKAVRIGEGAARLHLEGERPLFEVPVKGQVTMVYRADRAAKMYIQLFAADQRQNYRRDVSVLKSPGWKSITLDIDEFRPSDRSRGSGRIPPGSPVTDIAIVYGEDGDKGSFWVNSLRIVELHP